MAWVYNHFVIFFPAVLCARINITTQPIRYFTVWIPPVRKQLLQLTVTFDWKRRSAPLLPANKRKPTRRKEMTSCPNKECPRGMPHVCDFWGQENFGAKLFWPTCREYYSTEYSYFTEFSSAIFNRPTDAFKSPLRITNPPTQSTYTDQSGIISRQHWSILLNIKNFQNLKMKYEQAFEHLESQLFRQKLVLL